MDASAAIVAKSDQLNAIDLVGRDVTVTIIDVKQGPADQPVHIITDLYGPSRPWKASKTALRDIVQVWGTDSTVWIGRRITCSRSCVVVPVIVVFVMRVWLLARSHTNAQ